MAHAEKCPICYGSGKAHTDYKVEIVGEPCHGCGGRGWVEVADEVVMPYPETYPSAIGS